MFGEVCHDAIIVMFLGRTEPIKERKYKAYLSPRYSLFAYLWHVTRGRNETSRERSQAIG